MLQNLDFRVCQIFPNIPALNLDFEFDMIDLVKLFPELHYFKIYC